MDKSLLESKRILLWCDTCKKMVWLRAKDIDGILLEALWHKKGYCLKSK